MTPDEEPWTRQPGETSKAYAAFCIYRDQGPRRSLRQTTRSYYNIPETTGISLGKLRQIEAWSSRNSWVERAGAYDDDQDRQRRLAQREAVEKMAEKHATAATGLIAAGLKRLMGRDGVERLDLAELGARDVLMFVTEGAKLERLARGEPGEVLDHRGAADSGRVTVVFRAPERDPHPADVEDDGDAGESDST